MGKKKANLMIMWFAKDFTLNQCINMKYALL